MGFATSKTHKRETQGKYFYLVFFSKDFIKIFSLDFKISASLVIRICLEGNTMRSRGAYSTKERMPSDIESPSTDQPGRLYLIDDVLPSRQKDGIGSIPPHILVSLVCTGLLIVLPSRQL